MELNPDFTYWDSIAHFASSLILAIFCVYYAKRIWLSTPEEWNEYSRSERPKNWRKWPIYNWLWRDEDNHPKLYLWQVRVGFIIAAIVSAFNFYMGTIIFLNHH